MECHHTAILPKRIRRFGGDVKEEYNDLLTVGFTMSQVIGGTTTAVDPIAGKTSLIIKRLCYISDSAAQIGWENSSIVKLS